MSKRAKQAIFVGLAVVLIAFAVWMVRPQTIATSAANLGANLPGDLATSDTTSADAEAAHKELTQLEDKVKQNPKDVKALTDLADYLFDQGMFARAADTYSTALEIDPKNSDVHTKLATSYFFQGMSQSAIREYKKIIEAEPTKVEAHYYLALALSHSDPPDINGAVASWKEVVKLAPDSELGQKSKTFIENYQKQGN